MKKFSTALKLPTSLDLYDYKTKNNYYTLYSTKLPNFSKICIFFSPEIFKYIFKIQGAKSTFVG